MLSSARYSQPVPALDVIDEHFVVAPAALVAPALCDERAWAGWLPGLTLACTWDRGDVGKQWTVAGELSGTAEVWLEPWGDGTLVHVYLRCDPARPTPARRLRRTYALPLKAAVFAVKDRLEVARRPGEPDPELPQRPVVSASTAPAAGRRAGRRRIAAERRRGGADRGGPRNG